MTAMSGSVVLNVPSLSRTELNTLLNITEPWSWIDISCYGNFFYFGLFFFFENFSLFHNEGVDVLTGFRLQLT